MARCVNYPSLTQGALHAEGEGMFTMPQTFGNIARMPMFTLAVKVVPYHSQEMEWR